MTIRPLQSAQDWQTACQENSPLEACTPCDPYMNPVYQGAVCHLAYPGRAGWQVQLVDGACGEPAACGFWVVQSDRRRWGEVSLLRSMDYNVTRLRPMMLHPNYEQAAWKCLLECRGDLSAATGAHLMSLHKLPAESARTLCLTLQEQGVVFTARPFKANPHIRLGDDLEEYWKPKSPKSLYNIRRSERMLSQELGTDLSMRRWRGREMDQPDAQEAMGGFESLLQEAVAEHTQRNPQDLPAEAIMQFHREVLADWLRRGCVDFLSLQAGGRHLAGQVNLLADSRVLVSLMAFRREHARWSPGRILFCKFLSDTHARGERLIELGGEGLHWKQEWANLDLPTWSVVFPLGGAKGAAWATMQRARQLLKGPVRLPKEEHAG